MPSYSYLRRTGAFLSLSIKRVECADGVVEQGPIDLPLQLSWESGCKLDTTSLKTMIAGSGAKKGFPTWEKSLCTKTFLQLAWERVVV